MECFSSSQDKEEADYVEWLKGQAELEVKDGVEDMVSKVQVSCDFWDDVNNAGIKSAGAPWS